MWVRNALTAANTRQILVVKIVRGQHVESAIGAQGMAPELTRELNLSQTRFLHLQEGQNNLSMPHLIQSVYEAPVK